MFGGGGGGPQSGTGPPYSFKPEQERDNTAAGGPQTLTYHSISRMQVYQAKSFEELRMEDYAKVSVAQFRFSRHSDLAFRSSPQPRIQILN